MGNGESYGLAPRKPKLIWTAKSTRRIADPVPSQVLEVVRPFQAGSQARLELVDAEPVVNRPIWTNDNLVALTSLLEGDQQHEALEGKVDLIYIDPPFAVQADFTYEVEIDDDTTGDKLPSLIEELAYTDTWREGLDSYLATMRDRLELLVRLLAPTRLVPEP
jgi:adenine-specific DNA-methyltransferase